VFAYYAFGNTRLIPGMMFGDGTCEDTFRDYPVKPTDKYFNEFLLY